MSHSQYLLRSGPNFGANKVVVQVYWYSIRLRREEREALDLNLRC